MKEFVNSVPKFDWAILEVEKLRDFLIGVDGDYENMEDIIREIRGKRDTFIQDNFFCKDDEAKEYVLIYDDDDQEKVYGIQIGQNKLIEELSVGYMYYFKTLKGLRRFSSMNCKIL